jgi:hypothetical protein
VSAVEICRVLQKKGHCGPTSLVMMLSLYGLVVSQEAIAEAAGVQETISEDGSRIDELNLAIETLVPGYRLMAKYDSSLDDLESLVEGCGLPTGVEWQGVFVDDEGAPFEEGHYSVVVGVDRSVGVVTILDPERRSALVNGELSIADFEERWWEENDVPSLRDPEVMEVICNQGLLFVVVPEEQVPQMRAMGLQPVSLLLMREHQVPRRRV